MMDSTDKLNLNIKHCTNINVTLNYPNDNIFQINLKKNLSLPLDRTLKNIFKDFLRSNSDIKMKNKEYYFYLIKDKTNSL